MFYCPNMCLLVYIVHLIFHYINLFKHIGWTAFILKKTIKIHIHIFADEVEELASNEITIAVLIMYMHICKYI